MSSNDIAAQNARAEEAAETPKLGERLGDFIIAHRKALLAVLVAVAAALAGLGVYAIVERGALAASTEALEKLEGSYSALDSVTEADKAERIAAVAAEADALIAAHGGRYAAARAMIIKAESLYAGGDAEGARKAFASLAEAQPRSHLAPVALFNAAVVAEDSGDLDAAAAYLTKYEEAYPDAPAAERARLSLGRVYEAQKSYDKAMETYLRLVAGGSDSDWTKLARDRIILLKSQGLAK